MGPRTQDLCLGNHTIHKISMNQFIDYSTNSLTAPNLLMTSLNPDPITPMSLQGKELRLKNPKCLDISPQGLPAHLETPLAAQPVNLSEISTGTSQVVSSGSNLLMELHLASPLLSGNTFSE